MAKPVKDKGCPKNKLSKLILHNIYQPMITLVQMYRIYRIEIALLFHWTHFKRTTLRKILLLIRSFRKPLLERRHFSRGVLKGHARKTGAASFPEVQRLHNLGLKFTFERPIDYNGERVPKIQENK